MSTRQTRFTLAVLAVGLLGSIAVMTPALAGPQTSPPAGTDRLLAISCPTAKACVAVGERTRVGHEDEAISYVWNGSAWRLHRMVNVSGERYEAVQGVDCLSPTNCLAVGDVTRVSGTAMTPYPQVEHWNGSRWRLRNLRLPAGTSLLGVACTSRLCMLVGSRSSKDGDIRPIAVQLTTSNRVVRYPAVPGGRTKGLFRGVSCPTSSGCTAVGSVIPGPAGNSSTILAERWSAGRWRAVRLPHLPGLTALESVSCTAAIRCMAAGWPIAGNSTGGGPVTLRESAGRWTTVIVKGAEKPNYEPEAVSCPSARQCLTAGFSNTSVASRPGAASWNGRKMSFTLTDGAASGDLDSISCQAVRHCVAVGFTTETRANPAGALAESWNGHSWKVLPTNGK